MKHDFKKNEKVLYEGKVEVINRIDNHVHPICLKGIGRVQLKEIKKMGKCNFCAEPCYELYCCTIDDE